MLWTLALLLGTSALAGIAMWAWFLRTPQALGVGATWVLTREGLVRFEGPRAVHLHWDDVARVEVQVHHAVVHLKPGTSARHHRLAPGGADDLQTLSAYLVHEEEVDGPLATFVERATRVIHDPELRGTLPTFTQPEGPPEAVLADLDRPRAPGDSMFHRDLKTLCDGLDPAAFAEELKLLSSCRGLADLQWLADNNDGWLTKNRRNPKVKLVKHGTGTFLVVKYDDGWSSTLSKAPFRA